MIFCWHLGKMTGYSGYSPIMPIMTLKKSTPLWAGSPLPRPRMRLESCKLMGWIGMAEAALKLSVCNHVCARLSLFSLDCIRITLIY